MSGKPASPAAAGTPRLLLYVADPRQVESAPADSADLQLAPRPPYCARDVDHRALLYSKQELDSKLCVYGSNDQALSSPADYFQVNRPHCKDINIKENIKLSTERFEHIQVKQGGINPINSDYSTLENFQGRIQVEGADLYQQSCPLLGSDNTAPPMQTVLFRNGQNQFSEIVQRTSDSNCSEREVSVDKSYVNYQLLEQSVTHQSIVNQSISILNQQVGVNRVVSSEGESGSSPQLVRTADGVVLAVLPPSVGPQHSVDGLEVNSRTLQQTEIQQTITVPLGWRRIINGTSVLYVSPSGTALSTIPQLKEYLQTTGTCKCGLPCPLRPEITFSFDSKVASKPYQTPSGGELTKLCNHKRKLLATLNAQAQSPGTPPPQQPEYKKGTEIAAGKKKMKKRPGFPNVSPMMMPRDRQTNEYKPHEIDQSRTISPGLHQRPKANQCLPYATSNMTTNNIQQDLDKADLPVQRSSHYLTVNSGWIQQESVDQKNCQPNIPINQQMNVGLPVLGTNGQIIGVNTTGYNKLSNYKTIPNIVNQQPEQENKEHKREMVQNNMKQSKEGEAQIFCGLNQPLTPEVMQKINEQQQLFIQQNQKQIEMAMKGYRSQLTDNVNKTVCQNQYVPQGQLVIQNGTVVKANTAKTPPWQVKARHDVNASESPTKYQKQEIEYEDTNMNLSEESSNSTGSYQSDQMNQAMCSRVPPLPQHYNMVGQQWQNIETNKKKPKTRPVKKKCNVTENKNLFFNNNGMRMVTDAKSKPCDDLHHNNVPSFMDDPNGYLAQQTVLLNNTISKQVGLNQNSYDSSRYDSGNNQYNSQILIDKGKNNLKSCDNMGIPNTFRNNMVSHPSPSPNSTPDSSVISDKAPENYLAPCCRGAPADYAEHAVRRQNYMRQNFYGKMETDPSSATPSPKHGLDDSPVTSSTVMAGSPDGPIQAATVSTSNVSPSEAEPDATARAPDRYADGHEPRATGPQVMHFISNHNVNKNLMDVDNISMVGVRPGEAPPRMPGYRPPPHLGGGPPLSMAQAWGGWGVGERAATAAGGLAVTRDTVTSVQAGRARTATTSVNAAQPAAPRPPPGRDPSAAYAIPDNQPDPFVHCVNLPTSYPLHIAGTTAQNMISKSPLEMVQNVIGGSPAKSESQGRRPCRAATPGQILISSTGQLLMSGGGGMPPPPPKSSPAGGLVVLQPPLLVDGDLKHAPQHAMLSPDALKKKNKKKKSPSANVTNVLQITAPQQNVSNLIVHSSPQQNSSPQFSPRGFQLSPNSLSPAPLLQALTIVPGKSGAPAHIVMNGQGNANNFSSQQIIANTSPSQQINLLQPVNLINNASGVVPNFPAFQQFIVPNIGGMVMTADGTAIIQDNATGVPMQLQLQTVNGQNVLTPVQNSNVFAAGTNGGVVIRAQSQQGKIIQSSQHSPGAQFLSPNSQVMMNSPNFNGQLSPLLANLSPPNVTFNTSPHQVRAGGVQAQEFLANQLGQALMVPLSPKHVSAANRSNTFVQQNTTIVQQQTTLVSNAGGPRLGIDPSALHKMAAGLKDDGKEEAKTPFSRSLQSEASTQTLVNRNKSPSGSSPPDTTTHSPPGVRPPASPAASPAAPADTTTRSPEPNDMHSTAMVQCVSSSEQDMAESREHSAWSNVSNEFSSDSDTSLVSNIQLMRQTRHPHTPPETTDVHYHRNMNVHMNSQQHMPITQTYYDRSQQYKRKNEFGDCAGFRNDKIMRTSFNMVHGQQKEIEFEHANDKMPKRHFANSGGSNDNLHVQKVFDMHNLANDTDKSGEVGADDPTKFEVGDLVWGPVKGYASWPGKLEQRVAGQWRVRWFGGDRASARVTDDRLLTLSEGLEAHHAARTKHRKSRKLNTHLENAIQEAMSELDKKSASEDDSEQTASSSEPSGSHITVTPKRGKRDKKGKDKNKRISNLIKIAPNTSKTGEGARFRTAR